MYKQINRVREWLLIAYVILVGALAMAIGYGLINSYDKNREEGIQMCVENTGYSKKYCEYLSR